jgi:hypothetical protein
MFCRAGMYFGRLSRLSCAETTLWFRLRILQSAMDASLGQSTQRDLLEEYNMLLGETGLLLVAEALSSDSQNG